MLKLNWKKIPGNRQTIEATVGCIRLRCEPVYEDWISKPQSEWRWTPSSRGICYHGESVGPCRRSLDECKLDAILLATDLLTDYHTVIDMTMKKLDMEVDEL